MTQRIHSVYLTEEEEAAVRAVARHNGASVNFVVRAAVRQFLGRPTPKLELPAREAATSSD